MDLLPVLLVMLVATATVISGHRWGGRGHRGGGFGRWSRHKYGSSSEEKGCSDLSDKVDLSSAGAYRLVRQCYTDVPIPDDESGIINGCRDEVNDFADADALWFRGKEAIEAFAFYECLIDRMGFIDEGNLNTSAVAESYDTWQGDDVTIDMMTNSLRTCVQNSTNSTPSNVQHFIEIMLCFGTACKKNDQDEAEEDLDLECIGRGLVEAAQRYRDDDTKYSYEQDPRRQFRLIKSTISRTLEEVCEADNPLVILFRGKGRNKRRGKREAELGLQYDAGDDLTRSRVQRRDADSDSQSDSPSDESESGETDSDYSWGW